MIWDPPDKTGDFITIDLLWVSVSYILIIACSLILLSAINLIDEERRLYIHLSIASGTIGCLLFSLYFFLQDYRISYFGAIFVGVLMLAFMNMSGFKAK